MEPGFRKLTVDRDFAQRSAQYLAAQGYQASEIRNALVEQLDMPYSRADDILSRIAA